MTCIVGLEHGNSVYMGGDSAGVAGLSLEVRADQKVFIRDRIVWGFCGSYRFGQLVRYRFETPEFDGGDLFGYMVGPFVDQLRKCLSDGGASSVNNGVQETDGGFALVGVRGQLFRIGSDFQVGRPLAEFSAIGCGYELAIGAMATERPRSPFQRVEQALQVAEGWSAGVRRPFTIEKMTWRRAEVEQ